VHEHARPAAAAITFLTAVPVPRAGELGERDLLRGAPLFPLVGALVGATMAAVAWGAAFALPPLAAAVLGVAAGVGLTAALHLDGLADVADGIGATLGGREPAEAMRDPRLGAFGVAALALDLLLKVSVLAALVSGPRFPLEVVAAASLARAAPLVLAAGLPYARPTGTGSWTRGIGLGSAVAAATVAIAVGVASARVDVVPMVAAAALVTASLGRWASVRLGGTTGDVFGATAELTETFGLAAALAIA
jgi:adenosylcobinamide-GDP ribazoletransferase